MKVLVEVPGAYVPGVIAVTTTVFDQPQCPDLEAGGLVASARQSFMTLHIPGLCALSFPPVIILTVFPDNEHPQ